MPSDHGSDEWLMQEVARGRREHVATLLRRYANPLLTFIRRMIGDRHRAEELFQEVFLAVWTHRKTYEYPRRFRPWLFGIAINKCRADFRKPVPLPIVLDESSVGPLVAAGPSPTHGFAACRSRRGQHLEACLDALARAAETQVADGRDSPGFRAWAMLDHRNVSVPGCRAKTPGESRTKRRIVRRSWA